MSYISSIRVINFLGRTSDWEGWSKKFLARSKKKGYKKLLTGKDDIPTAEECEKAVADGRKSRDDIIKFNDLNGEAFEEIILRIDHTTMTTTDDESIKENGF